MAEVIARQGDGAELLAPDGWNGDELAVGWIVRPEGGAGLGSRAWQVPIGSAMARGGWIGIEPEPTLDPLEFVPWPPPDKEL